MEVLNQFWVWFISIFGGLSLSALATAIIYGLVRKIASKTIKKMNIEKVVENVTDKAVDKVKTISFKQSIQPLANSELEKINEKADEHLKKYLEEVKENYNDLIKVIEKLANYFDQSIYVPEEKKKELHNAIDEAKNEPQMTQTIVVEENVSEEPKKAVDKAKKGDNNNITR